MRDAREPDAAGILLGEWGIDVPVSSPHRGISRLTWQAGAVGWLARESVRRLDETQSEVRLLATLTATADFAVPTPIPTLPGPFVATVGGYSWTLCQHVAGERVNDEPSSYRRMVEILAVVHRGLRDLDPLYAVLPTSLLSLAQDALQGMPGNLAPPAVAAVAWLRGRIGVLDALTPQIIHGDFGRPNVLVAADNPAQFGILDWELSSHDSPIFDLAQLAFGMIAFSPSPPHPSQLDLLTGWYAAAGGEDFSAGQLAAALVAGRLAHIAWLQGRVAEGEATLAESVRFLDERLGRTLRWLEHRR